MRTLLVTTFVTLDGVMQAPGGPEEDPSGGFGHVDWQNARLLEGDAADAVRGLKETDGLDLQVHGSGDLIQTLLEQDLVDEFRIWVFPVVLGAGRRLFAEGTTPAGLELVDTKVSSTGVVLLSYRRSGSPKYGSFAGALALTIAWIRSAITRSGVGISAILASTSLSALASFARVDSALSSLTRSRIALFSPSVNPLALAVAVRFAGDFVLVFAIGGLLSFSVSDHHGRERPEVEASPKLLSAARDHGRHGGGPDGRAARPGTMVRRGIPRVPAGRCAGSRPGARWRQRRPPSPPSPRCAPCARRIHRPRSPGRPGRSRARTRARRPCTPTGRRT